MHFIALLFCASFAIASTIPPTTNNAQLNILLGRDPQGGPCLGCTANGDQCACANPCDCGGADAGNVPCCVSDFGGWLQGLQLTTMDIGLGMPTRVEE